MIMTERTAAKVAESVGSLLEQARLDLGVSVEDAARDLRVMPSRLRELELGDHRRIPDDIYTRILLKAYCRLIGLDMTSTLNLWKRERQRLGLSSTQPGTDRRHPTAGVSAVAMLNRPRLVRSALAVAAGVGLAAYLIWAVKGIVAPPTITLNSPRDGLVTVDRTVTVEGRTESEVAVRVNGKTVTPDSRGNFRDTLDLQEGLNTIKVVGMKRHSKETTVTRRVIVEPTVKPTAALHEGTGLGL
jgi:cytoskeletal protein RodZ